jgi:hypothetical protein
MRRFIAHIAHILANLVPVEICDGPAVLNSDLSRTFW